MSSGYGMPRPGVTENSRAPLPQGEDPGDARPRVERRRDDPPADAGRRRRLPDQHEPRRPADRRRSWSSISARSRRNSTGRRRSCSTCRGPSSGSASSRAGGAMLEKGQRFIFDRERERRRQQAASSSRTPSCSKRSRPATKILIDDGKVRLQRRSKPTATRSSAEVEVGGAVSDNKGVNVPDVVVPIPALTDKDRDDLAVRARAAGRLDRLVVRAAARGRRRGALADRRPGGAAGQDREAGGDRPAERHHRACRRGDGRARRPWRRASARAGAAAAEQDRRRRAPVRQAGGGRDADARIDDRRRRRRRAPRSATSRPPSTTAPTRSCCRRKARPANIRVEAVQMMDRIAQQRRARPVATRRESTSPRPGSSRPPPTRWRGRRGRSRSTVSATAMVCYTSSGATARRIARERPPVPLLAMSASQHTARRMGLLWGVHAVHSRDVAQLRGDGREGQAHGAPPPDREGRRPDRADGRDPVRDRRLDQRAARRPADRRRARTLPGRARLQRGSNAGISSAISRARKPIGPTFLREPRAGFAVEPHRPQQGVERFGAAREQAADDPGENVAAARHAEARRAALVGPAFARRGDDMAGRRL